LAGRIPADHQFRQSTFVNRKSKINKPWVGGIENTHEVGKARARSGRRDGAFL
jgi:hypothetical protein